MSVLSSFTQPTLPAELEEGALLPDVPPLAVILPPEPAGDVVLRPQIGPAQIPPVAPAPTPSAAPRPAPAAPVLEDPLAGQAARPTRGRRIPAPDT